MWAIILGILIGTVIYVYLYKHVFYQTCLVDGNTCHKLLYKIRGNSALINVLDTPIHVWFDGRDAFIYGHGHGKICDDTTKEVAYVVDLNSRDTKGWVCANTLDHVKHLMINQPERSLLVRGSLPSAIDLLHYLDVRHIINLNVDQ